jgi:hypothetical protein
VVRPAGLEPAAFCLGGGRSIRLSYGRGRVVSQTLSAMIDGKHVADVLTPPILKYEEVVVAPQPPPGPAGDEWVCVYAGELGALERRCAARRAWSSRPVTSMECPANRVEGTIAARLSWACRH